jgi:hypothetical protein
MNLFQTQQHPRRRTRDNAKRKNETRRVRSAFETWASQGCLTRSLLRTTDEQRVVFCSVRPCVQGDAGRLRSAAAYLRSILRYFASGDRRWLLASLVVDASTRETPTTRGRGRLAQTHLAPSLLGHITYMVYNVNSFAQNGFVRLASHCSRHWTLAPPALPA